MKPTNTREFKQIALLVRNGNPEAWDRFLNYFSRYTEESLIAVSEADAVNIMTVKGMALQNRALLKLFSECDQEVKKSEPIPQ
jgi:hypothetical protein